MPVDYEGYLGIESNLQERAADRKIDMLSKKKHLDMGVYDNCRESAGSAKTASSNKRMVAPPICQRNMVKAKKPEDSEYGLLSDLIKKVRAI